MIAHIDIRGFIVKNVIDFDEVGGFQIVLEEDMVKHVSRDKIREMLATRGHESFDLILDKILDEVYKKSDG